MTSGRCFSFGSTTNYKPNAGENKKICVLMPCDLHSDPRHAGTDLLKLAGRRPATISSQNKYDGKNTEFACWRFALSE